VWEVAGARWVACRYASAGSLAGTNGSADTAEIGVNVDGSDFDWDKSDAASDTDLTMHTQGSRGGAAAAAGVAVGSVEGMCIGPECDSIAAALLVIAAV